MAVCPKCESGVGMNAEVCPNCGANLQIIPEPNNDPLEVLKEDLENYVEETVPEDLPMAEQQIEAWQPTIGDGPGEVVTSEEDARPVEVYNAPDESSANLVASLLRGEGIDAMISRHTIPMLDTAQQMDEGVWGYVLVHQVDEERAKEILAVYGSSEDNLNGDNP